MKQSCNFYSKVLFFLIWGLSLQYSAQAQCSIAVLSQVNFSLPSSCSVTPTVAQVLFSQNCPGGSLVIQTYIGGVWYTNRTFTYANVGQSFIYRVKDLVSGNSASGVLKIEDKTPPTLICPSPITVYCENSCIAQPEATYSDCSPTVSLITRDWTTTYDCTSSILTKKEKSYTATDASGNSSTCVRSLTILRRPLSSIIYPANITLSVSGTDCSPWCEDISGRPAPSSTQSAASFAPGVPRIGTVPIAQVQNPSAGCNGVCVPNCAITSTYSDVVSTICGTNRKISRKWTSTSACGGATTIFTQTITLLTDGNAACGLACSAPTGLTHLLPGSSSVRFNWTAPSSCVVRYQVQYRFKVGSTWNAWLSTTSTSPTLLVTYPAGTTSGQFVVSTVCNGISSTSSSIYNFLVSGFDAAGDRDGDGDNAVPPPFSANETDDLKIWPNPSQGEVTIDMGKALSSPAQLSVLTIGGQLLSSQTLPIGTQQASLDLSNQPNGLYLFRIQADDKMYVEKIQVVNQ